MGYFNNCRTFGFVSQIKFIIPYVIAVKMITILMKECSSVYCAWGRTFPGKETISTNDLNKMSDHDNYGNNNNNKMLQNDCERSSDEGDFKQIAIRRWSRFKFCSHRALLTLFLSSISLASKTGRMKFRVVSFPFSIRTSKEEKEENKMLKPMCMFAVFHGCPFRRNFWTDVMVLMKHFKIAGCFLLA